jgi:hypothetical protein
MYHTGSKAEGYVAQRSDIIESLADSNQFPQPPVSTSTIVDVWLTYV